MAIVSSSAARGAAIAATLKAAAAAQQRINAVVPRPVANVAPQPVTRAPAYVPPRVAVQPTVTRANPAPVVNRAVQKPMQTQQQSVNRAAAMLQAAAQQPQVRQRAATYEPVAAAYKFMPDLGGGGYENIENARAAARYTMTPQSRSSTPVQGGPQLQEILQQQFMDYEAMRTQGGMPPTRMGGYGPQYSPPTSSFQPPAGLQEFTQVSVAQPRPQGPSLADLMQQQAQDYEAMRGNVPRQPPGTFVPLDLQPHKPEQITMPPQDDLPFGIVQPHAPPPTLPQLQEIDRGSPLDRVIQGFEDDQKRGSTQSLHEQRVQEVVNLQAQIDSVEAYMETTNYYNNPNPMYQSQLNALRGERDQAAAALERTANPQESSTFGPLGELDQLDDFADLARTISGTRIPGTDTATIGSTIAGNPVSEEVREQLGNALDRVLEAKVPATDTATVGSTIGRVLTGPQNMHTRNIGAGFLILANASLTGVPGGSVIESALDRLGVREGIVDTYYNGYTGPGGTHFGPGGRAAFEYLAGHFTDDLPWVLDSLAKIGISVFTDPYTAATMGIPIAQGLTRGGRVLSALPNASRAERIGGAVLRGVGTGAEVGITALDTLGFEYLLAKPARKLFGSGALTRQSRNESRTQAGVTLSQAEADLARATENTRGLPPEDGVKPTGPPEPYPGIEGDQRILSQYADQAKRDAANAAVNGQTYRPRPMSTEQQAAYNRLRAAAPSAPAANAAPPPAPNQAPPPAANPAHAQLDNYVQLNPTGPTPARSVSALAKQTGLKPKEVRD